MIRVLQVLQKKMSVFSYIIYHKKTLDCAVIDPSTQPEIIFDLIESKNFNLKAIINTHGHSDHTCGNLFLIDKTGAPLYLHKNDAVLAAKFSSKFFSRLLGGRVSPVPDYFVEDNDIVKAGELHFEVIHTPGHTKGGICLFIDNNLFTGDTLFVGDLGRTDLPGGSLKELKRSVKEKLFTLPGETIVWPGHAYSEENSSTIQNEINTNPYIT